MLSGGIDFGPKFGNVSVKPLTWSLQADTVILLFLCVMKQMYLVRFSLILHYVVLTPQAGPPTHFIFIEF